MLVPPLAYCLKWLKLHLLSQTCKVQCFHYTIAQNHVLSFTSKRERERGRERENLRTFPISLIMSMNILSVISYIG